MTLDYCSSRARTAEAPLSLVRDSPGGHVVAVGVDQARSVPLRARWELIAQTGKKTTLAAGGWVDDQDADEPIPEYAASSALARIDPGLLARIDPHGSEAVHRRIIQRHEPVDM
jgi:hypothetical protein